MIVPSVAGGMLSMSASAPTRRRLTLFRACARGHHTALACDQSAEVANSIASCPGWCGRHKDHARVREPIVLRVFASSA